MASQKIEEFTLDLAELNTISSQLKRQRNIDAISLQKKRIETEITNLRAQLASANADTPKARPVINEAKRYECEISNYAWDQSDKFVKFFIALDSVQDAPEENVQVTFTPNSIVLKVINVQNKDHKFEVKNLLDEINLESSYRKIKTNSIAIYAKKATEGKKWSHLTSTEKRLADLKKLEMEGGADFASGKDDPGAGLMKIMQNMYEKGDSETKRMIAKAWTEGQQKSMTPDFSNFKI